MDVLLCPWMDGHVCNYGAKSQEGGAIYEPKDGVVAQGCAVYEPKDGVTFLTYNLIHTTYNLLRIPD